MAIHNTKAFFILLLISLGLDTFCLGQHMFYQHYDYSSGLPSHQVYGLEFDKEGFLYLGTEVGLIKFNGISFSKIENPNSDGRSISSIVFADDNTLWCRNFAEQVFFLGKNGLELFQGSTVLNKKPNILDIKADGNLIYVGTFNHVICIDNKTKKVLAEIPIPEIDNMHVLNHVLYVSGFNGRLYQVKNLKLSDKAINTGLGKIRLCGEKQLLMIPTLNSDGCYYTLKGDKTNKRFTNLKSDFRVNRATTINNILYLSTTKGTFKIEKNEAKELGDGLNHSGIVQDEHGSLWISSLEKGLLKFPSSHFLSLCTIDENDGFLDIIVDQDTVYALTKSKKIMVMSSTGKVINSIQLPFENNIDWIKKRDHKIYSNAGIFDLKKNKSQILYFGKDLDVDDYGNQFSITHAIAQYISKDGTFQSLRPVRGRSVLVHEGYAYFAFVDQLIRYKVNDFSKQEIIQTREGNNLQVVDITSDDSGNVWFATISKGVYQLNETFAEPRFHEGNHLASNNCIKIIYHKGNLFVHSLAGIDQIDLKTSAITKVTTFLGENEAAIRSFTVSNNNLYVLTKNELIKIIQNTKKGEFKGKIFLRNVSATNGKSLIELPKNLTHEFNTLVFNYEILGFSISEEFEFRYKIKGYDETWQALNKESKSLRLVNLPDGTFELILQIKAGENTFEMAYAFSIAKPFWKSGIFVSIAALLFLGLTFLLMRTINLRYKKRQNLKEEYLTSQLKALRSQMNPHFLFNVLNTLQGLIYTNKIENASSYIGTFSDHLRKTLDASENNSQSIEKELESLNLYLDLEKMRFGEQLNIQVKLDSRLDLHAKIPSMILQPIVENALKHGLLHKIGEKNLIIDFTVLRQDLVISIIDDGIGRAKSREINKKNRKNHNSFAINSILKRIEILNKMKDFDISYDVHDTYLEKDQENPGTTVTLIIKNYLKQ